MKSITEMSATELLRYRPNMTNVQRKGWIEMKKHRHFGLYNAHFQHNLFMSGFDEGYAYAIRRLEKHGK